MAGEKAGPFGPPAGKAPEVKKEVPREHRILHVTAFRDPVQEGEKLQALYESLMDARREVGEAVLPFHRFAALVTDQVTKLRDSGSPEVAFRVARKDGKVNFTARGLSGDSR